MSDGITDAERDSEQIRLSRLNASAVANKVRDALSQAKKGISDLRGLGYTVELQGLDVKIYREL